MATKLSIPTSIAGISIPGAITGPLSKLYNNPYKTFAYTYPRNLGSDPTRKHVIEFVTRVPDPTYSQTAKALNGSLDVAQKAIETPGFRNKVSVLGQQFTKVAKNTIDTAVDIGEKVSNFEGRAAANAVADATFPTLTNAFQALSASDVVRKDGNTIRLYVPDTVNVSYSAAYDDLSLAGVLGKPYFLAQAGVSMFDKYRNSSGGFDINKMVNAIGDDPYVRQLIGEAAGGPDAARLLTAGVGQALNPQLQVIFSGVGFRTFQFDFTLTPYSAEEAQTIKNIVFAFKLAAAPQVQETSIFGKGLFYKVPDRFKIRFLYDGQENRNVHKIAECVLENINVDYAPIGWATFGDGNPVQTKLTLQFKEIEIIDKTRIVDGY
jgi:hypothetical protein